jgi:two-component system secretion system response regulator SalR
MEIVLLDDHHMFIESLALVLQTFSDVSKVRYFTEVYQLEEYLLEHEPDMLLLDIRLGNQNGLQVGEELLTEVPDLNIIFLSGFDMEEYRKDAARIGGKAFVNKNTSIDELMDIIRSIVFGTETERSSNKESFQKLTQMEITVLQSLADGLKQEHIAKDLKVTRRTVNTHVQNILTKMEVGSSMQAVLKAVELGLITNNTNR